MGTEDLEALVFGTAYVSEKKAKGKASKNEEAPLKKKRKTGKSKEDTKEEEKLEAEDEAEEPEKSKKTAAWEDPDDEELEVSLGKRRQLKAGGSSTVSGNKYEEILRDDFVKAHGLARWADEAKRKEKDDDSEDEEDEEPIVASSAKLTHSTDEMLGIGPLKHHKVKILRRKNLDISENSRADASVKALQFHPSAELLMTAGLDKKLRFWAVDGTEYRKVSSYYFNDCPLQEAQFTPDGSQVLAMGPYRTIWSLDVETGATTSVSPQMAVVPNRFSNLTMGPSPLDSGGSMSSKLFSIFGDGGDVIVCDVRTKHPVRTLRMSSRSRCSVFSLARNTLWTADEACFLYEWDLAMGKCLQKSKEAWATRIDSLAVSNVSPYSPKPILAVGTSTGNVDMFDIEGPKLSKEPEKTLDHLTTAATTLRFHPQGELLAMGSFLDPNAFRLVHSGTKTVFENWPTKGLPLQKVTAVDFCRRAGHMAIGNEKGHVLLFQLSHYERQTAAAASNAPRVIAS